MKKTLLLSGRSAILAGGFLLGLALLLGASAGAQDLLKNGNFEAPFPGTDNRTNWTVVFQEGGPADFSIAGPSTEASNGGGGNGAHLRNIAPRWTTKAYFSQLVTNLTEGSSYTFAIQKMRRADYSKLYIWAALVSGITSNTVFGDSTTNAYSLVITAAASKQIEVQLHLTKDSHVPDGAEDYRSVQCWGHFDDCSLTLIP